MEWKSACLLVSAMLLGGCSDGGDDMSDDMSGDAGGSTGDALEDHSLEGSDGAEEPDDAFPEGTPRLDRDTLLDFVEHSRADIDSSPESEPCELHTVLGDPIRADGTLDTSAFNAGWHLFYHCDEGVIAYHYTMSGLEAGVYPLRDDTFPVEVEVVEYAHTLLDSDEVMELLIADPDCAYSDDQSVANFTLTPAPPHADPGGGGLHKVVLDEVAFQVHTDGDGVPDPASMLCY